ncbi:MAG: 16S rRNA (cytosine(1402)-N(4))-methyltransferase [Parcubacteria bacterium C7867-001]|nr:MAG: 16S rRNA (cytosine(1402)-N(4))-methyltransferase [Parcubacteria bacterium C7867-001]
MTTLRHDTVFLKEAIDELMVSSSDVVVDATVGGAGHFSAFEQKLSKEGTLIGIDADREALLRAEATLSEDGPNVHLVEDNFRNLGAILDKLQIGAIDKSLFDLGWSGFQLAANRGFSFKNEEPLLMTYGRQGKGSTAADLINTASEEAIADMLYSLGEERFARSIARGIAEAREQAPILSTTALVDVVKASTPEWYHHRRIHPATKTFQALRIAVNDEFGAIREGLAAALARTNAGGRVAVISFHSIEDRIVKTIFRDAAQEGYGTVLTKKPIVPSAAEVKQNPRARSAKLRVFEVASADVSEVVPFNVMSYA